MSRFFSLVWVGVGLLLNQCGGRSEATDVVDEPVGACVPGRQLACACASDRSGVQTCLRDRTFGVCTCGDTIGVGGGSSRGGSSSAGGRTSATGGSRNSNGGSGPAGGALNSSGGSPSVVLNVGAGELIDAFPISDGALVVLSTAIVAMQRDGSVTTRLASPREITAAAFDGETLVIADKARMQSYDVALSPIASGDLAEPCASGVLISDQRFVCGPENDWDRVFYTYDARTGELLASSAEHTYNGIPMRRVPGTDDFITVTTTSSPSDFHLYSVRETGEAIFINESPYHGDFRVTNVYGFDGSPPRHLITDAGLMLSIYGEGCDVEHNSFTSQCFTKDGALGTLTGAQLFVGMDADADGLLYGLVNPTPSNFLDPSTSLIAQRIDVSARTLLSQKVHAIAAGRIVVARHDAGSDALLVGYELGPLTFPGDAYPGYGIQYLDYGPER